MCLWFVFLFVVAVCCEDQAQFQNVIGSLKCAGRCTIVKDDDNQTLVLAASGVNLGGSLHADLRNFTRLQNLTFAGCNLSGTMVRLPPALVTFDIRNNNVNGTVAKSLFANRSLPLQRFVVANNDFAEIDFAAFDNAPNLTFLHLANSLAASQATRLHALPSESFLTSHRQLQALQLDGINFGTALPSLAPLNLTLLTARNCNFSGTVPSQIGRMTKLTGLFLNGNPITRLPSALSLTSLDLTGTSLNVSELLPFAAKLTALTFCRLPQPQVPCISSNNNKCSASNSTDCRPATTTATTVAALSTAVTTAAATPATTTSTATLSTTTTMSALSGPESLASAASDLTIPIAIGAGIAAVVLISAVVISIVVWRKK